MEKNNVPKQKNIFHLLGSLGKGPVHTTAVPNIASAKRTDNCGINTPNSIAASFRDIARRSSNLTFSATAQSSNAIFLPTPLRETNIQKTLQTNFEKSHENLAMWMDKAIHARNLHEFRDSLTNVHSLVCAEQPVSPAASAALLHHSHPSMALNSQQQHQFYPHLETLTQSPKFIQCLSQLISTGTYAPQPSGSNVTATRVPFICDEQGQTIASDLISQMISKCPTFEARKRFLQQLIISGVAPSAPGAPATNALTVIQAEKGKSLSESNSTSVQSVSAKLTTSNASKTNPSSSSTSFRGSHHAAQLKQELHVRTQKMDMMEMESQHLVHQINHISSAYKKLQSKYQEDIEHKHREVLLLRKENALLMNQFGLRMVPESNSNANISVAAATVTKTNSGSSSEQIIEKSSSSSNNNSILLLANDVNKKRKDMHEDNAEGRNPQGPVVNMKKPRIFSPTTKNNVIDIDNNMPKKSNMKPSSSSIADMMTLAQAANHKSQESLINIATKSPVHKSISSSNLLRIDNANIAQTQARARSQSEQFSNHALLSRFRSSSQGDLSIVAGRARSQSDVSLANSIASSESCTSESALRRASSSLDNKYLAIHSCRWKKRSSKGKISKTDLRVAHLPPIQPCTKHKFCRGGCHTVATNPDFQQRLRDEYCNFVREYDHHAGNLFLAKFLHPSQSKTKDSISRNRSIVNGSTVKCVWCQTVPNQAFDTPHEWTRETCPHWNDAQNFHIQYAGVKKFHYSIPWINEKNEKGPHIELCAPTFQAIYGLSSDRMTTVRKVRLHSSSYDETILDRRSFNGGHNAKSNEEQKALEAVLESEPRSCFKSADGSGKSIYYYKGNLSRFHFWRKYLLTNGNIQDVEFVLQSERLKFYPTFHNPKKRKHFPTAEVYAQDKAGKQLKPSIAYTTACTFWKNFDIRFAGNESDVLLLNGN